MDNFTTVKTIKPDGTGDYTSLQSWWDNQVVPAVDTNQTAVLYSGNVGGLIYSEPNNTPTLENHAKIIVDNGCRHKGVLAEDKNSIAWSDSTIQIGHFLDIDGLYMEVENGNCVQTLLTKAQYRLTSNFFMTKITNNSFNSVFYRVTNWYDNKTIWIDNNIFILKGALSTTPSNRGAVEFLGNRPPQGTFRNNTIIVQDGINVVGLFGGTGTNVYSAMDFSNNYIYSAFRSVGQHWRKNESSNNAVNDTSLTDYGYGSNNLENIMPGNQFIDYLTNVGLLSTSSLIGKGKENGLLIDIVGNDYKIPPSIGAFEYYDMDLPGTGKILFNTEEFKKIIFEDVEYTKMIFENEVIWSKNG